MEIIEVERKEIPFLPGYYVDKNAIVYHKDKIAPTFARNGLQKYCTVYEREDGKTKRRTYNTVKLMAVAWLNADITDTVCYYDKDQSNTTLDNIYIGTRGQFLKDNYEFKRLNGLQNDRRLTRNEHRYDTPIYQLDDDNNIVNSFASLSEACHRFDLPISSIERCCFNPKKTCCNYHWCFAYDYANRNR